MKVTFRPNPRLADELGNTAEMRRFLKDEAEGVRSAVQLPGRGRRTAPFTKKWVSRVEGTGREVHAVVGSRWRLAHIIEFGSINNPAYAPLRKAVRARGLKFEER